MATILTFVSIGCTMLGSIVTAVLSGMTAKSDIEGAQAFDEMEAERKGTRKEKKKPVYYYDWKQM